MQRISAPGSRPGLKRINDLLSLLAQPQQNLPVVHIAGTNGKGSTSLMVADILSIAGYRVGRFNSPHLHSYTERYAINGQEITQGTLKYYLDQIEALIPILLLENGDQPTEFEILTALAFLYFRDQQVDIAVLEVGMGGLYDSTNIVNPEVAVITSIDYDHTDYLGNTIEEIAMNKAGIIKPGVPVVLGEVCAAAQDVVKKQAARFDAPITMSHEVQVTRIQPPDLQGQYINLKSRHFNLKRQFFALLGDYQLNNLAAAISTIEVLIDRGYRVEEKCLVRALAHFKLAGRLEILQKKPLVIGDAAHNPHGTRALAKSLQELCPQQKRVLVCGMLDDKDIEASLGVLKDQTRAVVVTRPAGERSQNWQQTATLLRQIYTSSNVYAVESITAAVRKGLEILENEEYLLITGSFYVLDEAGSLFTNS
ncbi:Folylpolyglutamate synthetase [Syntrophomonas zehnderi OL-4]|uniref:tetrahydrofolate synthase n=1 Tax=Syntrophomonas zehnderi OL-4 TaxID=690567 RepID=A0A0E4C912_9FIRM|nr:folylpolyglutamate synthase/dihydrofolate synthase family protein [Syntrophomonas zehnderi]CFX81057.1 Folylpolyglutamate synthetase [Syntrophomonas zehnderi OL-4]